MADPTRLFLLTPVLSEPQAFAPKLAEALGAGDVACVLVRHATRDDRAAKALLRVLAPLVQDAGAAFLIEADPRLAAHVDADGVEIRGVGEPLGDAVESMKPDRIVGCSGLSSRDDAMTAGEADVDYLMFGEPRPDGSLPPPDETLDRVRWWAEIFNMPCVGFAQTLAEVRPIALAGAEFVAVGDAIWTDGRGVSAAIVDASRELQAVAAIRAEALQA